MNDERANFSTTAGVVAAAGAQGTSEMSVAPGLLGATLTRRGFAGVAAAGATTLACGSLLAGTRRAQAEDAADTGAFVPGTYRGTGEGKGGTLTLEMVFDADAIVSVEVVDHSETAFISDVALERVPAQIVERQSLAIDTVTGATLTSMAILTAARDCAEQAGADMDALETAFPVEPSADVELEADLVVVGAGASGMGMAIAAAQAGARVVVVEKTSNIGGNALVSGGYLEYTDAPEELREKLTDGYKEYFKSILAAAQAFGIDQSVLDTVQGQWDAYYATGTDRVFDSAEFYGLDFCAINHGGDYSLYDGGFSGHATQLADDWLTDLGIDWAPLCGIVGFTWPRFSGVRGASCGIGYFELFRRAIEERDLPVQIVTETRAEELIMEEGRVVGVRGTKADGAACTVRGRNVVLCAGGFSGSPELLARYDETGYWGWTADSVIPTTNAYGHTGDGVRMALAVGASVTGTEIPPMCFPLADCKDYSTETIVGDTGNCLFVNAEGKRFVNECASRYEITKALMGQTDQKGFIISDAGNCLIEDGLTQFKSDPEKLIARGQLFRADTLAELAELAGIDSAALAETVETYNAYARAYKDEEFGRTSFTESSPIEEGPFYASPRTWAAHITMCGLACDDQRHVLGQDGAPIPGLYVAGEMVPGHGGISSMGDGVMYADAIVNAGE